MLAYVQAALAAIELLSNAGQSISSILSQTQSVLSKAEAENRDPTAEERAALDATIKAEMDKLDAAKA